MKLSVLILSAALIGATGCVQTRFNVEIRTEPSGATIDIVTPDATAPGQAIRLQRVSPVEYEFDFAGRTSTTATFTVKATKEDHDPAERSLTREAARTLPYENGVRILTIPLTKAKFRDIEKAEVVVDPTEGLVVRFKRVRAFEEDIERQGVSVSKIVQLDENMSIGGLTIAADGEHIAFGVVERGRNEDGKMVEFANVRSISTQGGGITQMTTGRWLDIDPAFGADGEYLYLASNRLRTGGLDLLRINSTTTGGGIGVIHRQTDGWSRSPSEASTGLIAFSYLPQYARATGVAHIWTLGGENQYPTQIREGSQPRVSPDGGSIVYVGPDNKIWLVSTKAAAPVQLTTNPETRESEPTWSPDGSHLVCVSNEGRDNTGTPNNDIWIMRADGTQRRQLTTNGSDDVTPVVDPQGRWIYFVSNRGFRWGIWRMPWPTGLSR